MAEIGTFSSGVKSWITRSKADIERVFHEATKELVKEAQRTTEQGGNMHVDTGYLRASIRASLTSLPSPIVGNEPLPDSRYSYRPSVINRVIDSAKYGKDTIYIGWTASYAGIRENRDGFMRLAAQNWRSIVRRVSKRNSP